MKKSAAQLNATLTYFTPRTSSAYKLAACAPHRLVFNYPKGAHNVFKVNGTGFQECSAPLDYVPLTSGREVINLATTGRKWYICGVSQHCLDAGQKLAITVFPSSFVSSPSPTWGYSDQKENAASSPGPTWSYIN